MDQGTPGDPEIERLARAIVDEHGGQAERHVIGQIEQATGLQEQVTWLAVLDRVRELDPGNRTGLVSGASDAPS